MSGRLTPEKIQERFEAFKEKAGKIHNYKYGYLHFIFVNTHTKGYITCPIHGDFLQTPKNHLRGQGCPICGKEYAQNWSKNNYIGFLKTVRDRFGDDTFEYPNIEEEYKNSHSKITIKCKKCGNVFTKIACDHITSEKGGCKICYKKSFEKYYTYENLLKLNVLNLNIKPFEGEKEYREKMVVICPIHGEYEIKIQSFLKGKGKCKKCSGKKARIVDEFKKMFNAKYSDELYCNFDEYINMNTPITFKCKKCGHIFKRMPTVILSWNYKLVCPSCSKKLQSQERTHSTEYFINKIKDIHGENAFDLTNVVYTGYDEPITMKCNKCGKYITRNAGYFISGHGCPYHFNNRSKSELEIAEYIKSIGLNVIENDRTILNENKELDIYVPDKKIAIEFDGLYWHNELNKDKYYHLKKLKDCDNQGIRLIHIFEDEWLNKNNIWKSILNTLFNNTKNRIFARKCIIKEVNSSDSRKFLDENHLQGYCNSTFRYGLYYNNELVSLMTFGKTRHFIGNSSHEYELLRFCNKINTTVVGGASKLFKYFIKQHNPKNVVSYADRRWSNGNLYEKLGFNLYNISPPNYYYVIGNERKNRFNFRKSMLIKKYNCPKNMTEHEFCKSMKWYRIYDCGCLCYEWNSSNI